MKFSEKIVTNGCLKPCQIIRRFSSWKLVKHKLYFILEKSFRDQQSKKDCIRIARRFCLTIVIFFGHTKDPVPYATVDAIIIFKMSA